MHGQCFSVHCWLFYDSVENVNLCSYQLKLEAARRQWSVHKVWQLYVVIWIYLHCTDAVAISEQCTPDYFVDLDHIISTGCALIWADPDINGILAKLISGSRHQKDHMPDPQCLNCKQEALTDLYCSIVICAKWVRQFTLGLMHLENRCSLPAAVFT